MDEETNFIVQFGCGSTVGGRPYQEDRLVATRLNGSADHTYFAVFDGHGGDRCSEFLSRNFHKEIMNHPKFNALPIVALQETWATFDEKCLSNFKIVESSDPKHVLPGDGSTATACVINLNDIYLTNCGDSAAYVIHQDGSTECLTEDHGTNNKEEIARCVKAGGSLKPQFYHEPYPFPLCFMGRSVAAKPRMLPGGLLVTRSFGDFNAKLDYLGGRRGVVVSTHGRVSYINAKKTPPRYLVLASDGVWDVLSIAEVAAMIQRYFERRAALGLSLSSSASQLSSAAMNIDLYAPEQKSGKASPKGSSGSGSGKMSPRKVSPMVRPGSLTDLGNHNQNHNEDTASLVEAELINARYTDLSAELNEVATLIVNAAAASPKWKSLGRTQCAVVMC